MHKTRLEYKNDNYLLNLNEERLEEQVALIQALKVENQRLNSKVDSILSGSTQEEVFKQDSVLKEDSTHFLRENKRIVQEKSILAGEKQELKMKITELEEEIRAKNDLIAIKNGEIRRLDNRLNGSKIAIQLSEKQNDELTSKLTEKTKALKEQRERFSELKRQVKEASRSDLIQSKSTIRRHNRNASCNITGKIKQLDRKSVASKVPSCKESLFSIPLGELMEEEEPEVLMTIATVRQTERRISNLDSFCEIKQHPDILRRVYKRIEKRKKITDLLCKLRTRKNRKYTSEGLFSVKWIFGA